MEKAITTIKRVLNYPTNHAVWFAVNQALFNQIAAFYLPMEIEFPWTYLALSAMTLEVIQAQEKFLDFSNKEALRAREMFTHTKEKNPTPVIPLSTIGEDIPAIFRHATISDIPRQLRPSN